VVKGGGGGGKGGGGGAKGGGGGGSGRYMKAPGGDGGYISRESSGILQWSAWCTKCKQILLFYQVAINM